MTEKNCSEEIKQISQEMKLMHMIHGSRITQLIYVAAKLKIADLLKDGPKSCEELARAVDAHPRALYRLLRALASLEIFCENGDGCFQLTPLAENLQTEIPGSLAGYAIMVGEPWSWGAEGELLYSVKTGKPAFAHVHGMNVHEYLAKDAQAAKHFNEAMTSFSGHELAPVVNAYDFSQFKTIIDVGGGHGALLVEILKTYPKLSGKVYDLRAVDQAARTILDKQGVAKRCELINGDFFQSVPGGGDAYILKRVLHDWDDDQAVAILKVCHKAMEGSGRLLIIERVIIPGNEPDFGKLVDISMLTLAGGLERSRSEFKSILDRGGFALSDIIPTQCPLDIIEARPV
ncbi:MAG: methyltransferase [Pseudomonadota bacterium]